MTTKPVTENDFMSFLNHGFFRTLSILAATAVLVLIVLYPRAIAPDSGSVPHGWLVLLLYGMSIAWIHGFGFTPKHKIPHALLHPLVGWLALAVGIWKVFF